MKISILGIRGIPAAHGGFETFAEHFALYLVRQGWQVTVYCQVEGRGAVHEDLWQGVRRVHVPVSAAGAWGTVLFDLKSTLHAVAEGGPVLSLGYNTALFFLFYRLRGVRNITNMDGIEWRRGKWTLFERVWLYANEKLGAWLSNHLVADHPEIKKHLSDFVSPAKITMIPYGAELLADADVRRLAHYDLAENRYALIIARPEPENSILEIVGAFSAKRRNISLAVLGRFAPEENEYHRRVMAAASDEVRFVGAIYEPDVVRALRFHTRLYIHGHTVGGTNPSLVEALGAGSPVLAHDNPFNRWVAGPGACYFASEEDCASQLDRLCNDDRITEAMREASRQQLAQNFTFDRIHRSYEEMLREHLA